MPHTITIGTRGSVLALKQAELSRDLLLAKEPALSIEFSIIKTEGDGNERPIPLDTIGKGWFTKEIEEALLKGTIDIAAHSLKDLPEILPPGLGLVACLEREDARDVLVSRDNKILNDLPQGARIGTDSLRRKVQILALRPDLVVESIRGNILTRLQKLDAGGYDAIVLAAAGLKRVSLESRIAQYFSMTEITPAPGQGVLALETRAADQELNAFLRSCQDMNAALAAQAERAFARTIGGGCKSPVGAWAEITAANELSMIGMVDEGAGIVRGEMKGSFTDAEGIGIRLAHQLHG